MTITIGSQTNVPDPGSPITSPWAQDTARKLVHTFANAAARDAWASPPDGAMCVTLDNDVLYMYRSTAWVQVPNLQSADNRYVLDAGDTMSGALAVNGDITSIGGYLRAGGPAESGTVGVAAQAATGRVFSLCVNHSNASSVWNRGGGGSSDAGQQFASFQRLGVVIGSIAIAGSMTAVVYNTTSDPRLKHVDGDASVATDAVRQLGAAAFVGRWLHPDTAEPHGPAQVMLSSHDVEDVAPHAVTGERDAVDDDGHIVAQQVDYGSLVPLLMAALSQALDRITALEGGTS
jgi:hypothetical protein